MKHLVGLSCLVIAFLLNPLWGCGGIGEPEFEFGEQEMSGYAEGTWSGHMVYPSGEETDFELVITQGSHDTRRQGLGAEEAEYRTVEQPSCGDNIRHFVAAAQACGGVNKSVLPIEGRLTTSDGRYDATVIEGEMVVWGYELTNADIRFELDDSLALITECDDKKTCGEGAIIERSADQQAGEWGDTSAWSDKQDVTMEKI